MASGRRLFIISTMSSNSIAKTLLHARRTMYNGRFTLTNMVPILSEDSKKKNDNNNNNLDSYRRFFASTTTVNHPEGHPEPQSMRDRARAGMAQARLAGKASAERGQAMAKRGAATSFAKIKQYGPVFVGTYASLYLATLGTIYAGVDSGLVDPATIFSYISSGAEAESKNTAEIIIEYLNHYAWTKPAVPFFEKNPHFANLGVAWVATKFTEPIRLGVAMAVVPRLATYFGYHPPPTEEESKDAAASVVGDVNNNDTDSNAVADTTTTTEGAPDTNVEEQSVKKDS